MNRRLTICYITGGTEEVLARVGSSVGHRAPGLPHTYIAITCLNARLKKD